MNLKTCVYKNCESYTIHGITKPEEVVFFQFPKDAERRKKWMENGKVPISSSNSLYMCSLHFEKKFFSVNNRRTVLVGQAVPNEYVDDSDSDSQHRKDTEDNNIDTEIPLLLNKSLNTSDVSSEIEFDVSPDELYDHILNDTPSNNDKHYQKLLVTCGSKESDPKSNADKSYGNIKRKADSCINKCVIKKRTMSSATSSTTVHLCETSTEPNNNGKESNTNKSIVDIDHVTTFIFKGEEYVQMPKEYYVCEKDDLLKTIWALENKIERIKESVNIIIETND